jgi:hypothetical protein
MRPGLLFAVGACAALVGASPVVRPTAATRRLDRLRADSVPSLARFFEGNWHCRGGTPAGRTLDADVTFLVVLNSHWLRSEHVDVPPGRYHSLGLWPLDSVTASGTTTVYDNFGGARRFFGGWQADSIVWLRDTTEHDARLERFTYRRTSASTYWYAWHIRPAAGAPMVLGDSATCRRS